jgi:hypothetical protein
MRDTYCVLSTGRCDEIEPCFYCPSREPTLKDYGLIYLATPYSKWPAGLEDAFKEAAKLAARLLEKGASVYSPIAHTHPLAIHGGLDPLDHKLWLDFDEAMMERSDALFVATMYGWTESKGVAHEINRFAEMGKPIRKVDPVTLEVTL